MSADAFIMCMDDVLIEAVTTRGSERAIEIENEIQAIVEHAESKGMKLGLVSGMTSINIVVACETIFDRNFISRFDAVLPSDARYIGSLGLPGVPPISTALTVLGIPAHRAIAVVCEDYDAAEANDVGINERWLLGCN
ncbi:hypothetical protein AB4Y38_40735 [Paraburkholderia sp. EG285A]|uniref:hypothetical protein n=1 Tax=Paraburkholderia sp. EG285A TaxID=3237009 RepID=UPI0034D294AD